MSECWLTLIGCARKYTKLKWLVNVFEVSPLCFCKKAISLLRCLLPKGFWLHTGSLLPIWWIYNWVVCQNYNKSRLDRLLANKCSRTFCKQAGANSLTPSLFANLSCLSCVGLHSWGASKCEHFHHCSRIHKRLFCKEFGPAEISSWLLNGFFRN